MESFETHYMSQGITTVIGMIGRYSGSMIMDLSLARCRTRRTKAMVYVYPLPVVFCSTDSEIASPNLKIQAAYAQTALQ